MRLTNYILVVCAIAAMVTCSNDAFAQQTWQQSQYLQNKYLVNPAVAGEKDMLDINLSFRQQWLGVQYSPRTYYLSVNSRILRPKNKVKAPTLPTSQMKKQEDKKPKVYQALGGLLLKDEFGAFSQTLIALSYAVHVPMVGSWYFSAAVEANAKNYVFDVNSINMQQTNDPTWDAFYNNSVANVNSWEPNVDIGLYVRSDYLFFGYSTEQLIEAKLNYDEVDLAPSLSRTNLFYAGLKLQWSKDWVVTPSTLIKLNDDSPDAFDFNVKVDLEDRYYASVGYRLNDAFVLSGGVFLNDQIRVGYSYDMTMSRMNLVSSGSHEFFLGFELFKQ